MTVRKIYISAAAVAGALLLGGTFLATQPEVWDALDEYHKSLSSLSSIHYRTEGELVRYDGFGAERIRGWVVYEVWSQGDRYRIESVSAPSLGMFEDTVIVFDGESTFQHSLARGKTVGYSGEMNIFLTLPDPILSQFEVLPSITPSWRDFQAGSPGWERVRMDHRQHLFRPEISVRSPAETEHPRATLNHETTISMGSTRAAAMSLPLGVVTVFGPASNRARVKYEYSEHFARTAQDGSEVWFPGTVEFATSDTTGLLNTGTLEIVELEVNEALSEDLFSPGDAPVFWPETVMD